MRRLRRQTAPEVPDLLEVEPAAPRRRRFLWWAAAAVVLVAAAVGVSQATGDNLRRAPGTIRLTGAAKTFALDDVRAGRAPVSLEAFRGKPVVLNFFGSWCPPCVRELPALEAMAERYRGRVQFVGVTFNDTREAARSLLDRSGVSYPAAFDAKSDLAYDYGIQGMPTTLFIGPDGNLVEGKKGEFSEPQLQAVIDRLFGTTTVARSR
ncbi:MAG TPA: TlpA disulfide reductase family protein [Acidimicrobiia bacterium]|jgi:thiol-disulfide isomerase/thioredoxin